MIFSEFKAHVNDCLEKLEKKENTGNGYGRADPHTWWEALEFTSNDPEIVAKIKNDTDGPVVLDLPED